jgi:predicted transcriptional regulator of viral defense system
MDWSTLAGQQHGVLTLDQAVATGLTPSAVRWRVSSGRWQSLGRGLFLVHTAEPDWHARAAAAVLRAGRDAVLTSTSAAYRHGLQDRAPTRVTVAIPRERRVVPLSSMTVQRRDGLPSVTPHRYTFPT